MSTVRGHAEPTEKQGLHVMLLTEAGAASLLNFGLVVPANVDLKGKFRFEKSVRIYTPGTTLAGCAIGAYSYIVSGTFNNVAVGRYCSIAHAVEVGFHNHPVEWVSSHPFTFMDYLPEQMRWPIPHSFDHAPAPTTIGNDVWIGAHVKINGGLSIGDGAIVAAGSVVTKDVPPYTIVGGTPAKVIRRRFDDAIIDELMALRWWDYDWPEFLKYDSRSVRWDRPEDAIRVMKQKIASGQLKPYFLTENFNVIE
jgi:acetyltransferase-like isoleucine patch superfamily enzyme